MSKKFFSLTLIILLVFAVASPAFASNTYSASVYYPEPYVDEYSGYFSYTTSSNEVYTWAWTFLPYRSVAEAANASPYVEITYSSGQLRFDILPGLTQQSNFMLYRYYQTASSTTPSLTLMDHVTIAAATSRTYSTSAPVAVAFSGPVSFNNAETSSYFALDLTFSEDSNTNYNIELFYNYYKNMMDILYPAITAAFADINNIDLSVDNIETYSSQINSKVTSIINLLTTELVGSGDGSLQNPYTIRDLLVQIANNTGSEYSSADLDTIEASLSTVSDFLSNYTLSYYRNVYDFFGSFEYFSQIFYNFFSSAYSYSDFASLLESVASTVSSDFYTQYLEDHFAREEEFYSNVEEFLQAYNRSQVVDDRLDYNDSQENSLSIFSLFNRVVLQPFRDFWWDISAYFFFDSGFQRSDSVITDYLFYSYDLPGFNNLSDVDWSTLP